MGLSVKFYIKDNNMFIRLIGEMDQENVGNLRDKLIDIIKNKNVKNIIFNMKELSFMDSTGIGIIIGRYNQLKSKNGKVFICSINRMIERIILLSGLPRICIIKENEEECMMYLRGNYE